jgi:hypothetical protein
MIDRETQSLRQINPIGSVELLADKSPRVGEIREVADTRPLFWADVEPTAKRR